MHCKRCGGRVMDDTRSLKGRHLELSCLCCGRRWEIHRASPLGNYLHPFTLFEHLESD